MYIVFVSISVPQIQTPFSFKYLIVSFTSQDDFPLNWKTYKYDTLPTNAKIFRPETFIDEKGDMYMFANTGENEVNLSVYKRIM